ncbi:MAG: DUF488 domain-containing protein [Candidatus Saccharimonadales bacterium]
MNHAKGIAQVTKKEQPSMATIWTIGHSNKDITTFINLLQTVNVQTVVDCRTKPRSRWLHFNAEQLATHLASVQINYEFRGHNLGGLAGNVHFDETLDELKDGAEHGERIALLCSEGKPEQCHRGMILAPALEKRGVSVVHLLYEKRSNSHEQLSADW